jgi:hypothetical protein
MRFGYNSYHRVLEPLALTDDAEVQIKMDTEKAVSAEEIFRRAARVYQGLTAEDIAHVETIALDRQHFCATLEAGDKKAGGP